MKKLFAMAALLFMAVAASAQDKPTVCVDEFENKAVGYNNMTAQNLRNEVMQGITATDRLTVIDITTLGTLPEALNERVKAIGEKGVNYVLRGTCNSIVTKANVSGTQTYRAAEVNYTLTLINAETGVTMATDTYKDTWNIGANNDEAILKAAEMAKSRMKKYVDNNFKVEAIVKALDQIDPKKGGAKTVYVTVGSDAGISAGQIFEVFGEVNVAGENVRKKIGELKAKEVLSGTLTLCDVKSGGIEIKTAFEAGTTLTIVSRAKSTLFDKVVGD